MERGAESGNGFTPRQFEQLHCIVRPILLRSASLISALSNHARVADILERIVDREHHALGPELRHRVDQCRRAEMPDVVTWKLARK
jgi:hypothetical protein